MLFMIQHSRKKKSENEAKDKRFQFSIGTSLTTSTECRNNRVGCQAEQKKT